MTKRIPEEVKYLRKAKKLLEKPKAWTRGSLALDASGEEVDPDSDKAVCWCAVGAVDRVFPPGPIKVRALNYLFAAVAYAAYSVEDFNDCIAKDKRYVLRAYDRAIKLALDA